MSSAAAAPRAAVPLSPARAEASRRNGTRSRGPRSPEGKARSAQNALKHGLRAQKCVVLPCESAAEFEALEAALLEELAPKRALQSVLAQRVVAAAWRLARAERLEAQLFAENHSTGRSIGLALIRDCNGARAVLGKGAPTPFRSWRRSFATLLRYRGGTLAELWRALRTPKALQAEQAARPAPAAAPHLLAAPHATPIEPKSQGNPGDSGRADLGNPDPAPAPASLPHRPLATADEATPRVLPIEPERREHPAKAPPSLPTDMVELPKLLHPALCST